MVRDSFFKKLYSYKISFFRFGWSSSRNTRSNAVDSSRSTNRNRSDRYDAVSGKTCVEETPRFGRYRRIEIEKETSPEQEQIEIHRRRTHRTVQTERRCASSYTDRSIQKERRTRRIEAFQRRRRFRHQIQTFEQQQEKRRKSVPIRIVNPSLWIFSNFRRLVGHRKIIWWFIRIHKYLVFRRRCLFFFGTVIFFVLCAVFIGLCTIVVIKIIFKHISMFFLLNLRRFSYKIEKFEKSIIDSEIFSKP